MSECNSLFIAVITVGSVLKPQKPSPQFTGKYVSALFVAQV